MTEKKQNIGRLLIFLAWLFIVSAIIKGLVIKGKTNIIIQMGINGFKTLDTFTSIITGTLLILVIIAAATMFLCIKAEHDVKKQQEERKASSESKDPLPDVFQIQSRLSYHAGQLSGIVPERVKNKLLACASRFTRMDSYQEKLSTLLNNNGAHSLSDTEDVLNRVEQYLIKNVCKVLNYVTIADPDNGKDIELLEQKLDGCMESMDSQLDQVKELLVAMADFLNKQGEDDTAPETLELYKSTILKSLTDDEET